MIFLKPLDKDKEDVIGKVSVDIFIGLQDVKLNDIETILKPAFTLYKQYLNI